ncbi:hypothetical protein O7599_01665 [Streptomyces sp. WMMC500]|uniref:hypothetical protein n=1 Tax=Streptomyces sp. WMMC500 TaxID=3015154 RepID=UPI00248C0059|nr:hypothetical protein [Streptomyces sp. WMMC500]WBB61298.1 hypothetical protein O7599_01665 [Streptomyces sp. WMMC500]
MERYEEFIETELVDVAGLSLDEILLCDMAALEGSARRVLLQVDLPKPLVASKDSGGC